MMARFSTILSFLLCALLLAQTRVSAAAQEPALLPLMLVDQKSGSYCTAFPISSDGYLMTAEHCLKRCFDEQKYEAKRVSDLSSEIQCSGYELPDLKISKIKVVARGNILRQKKVETRFGDFAILKIETQKPISCLTLSAAPASAGEALKVVGFPVPKSSKEKPKLNSSTGNLYAGPEQSEYYRSKKSERARAEIADLYAFEDGVLYSNAHHLPGQSGGPVLDKNGKVIGVVSGFTITRSRKALVHEMVAGSTAKILAALPANLSNQLLEKSRGCETHL